MTIYKVDGVIVDTSDYHTHTKEKSKQLLKYFKVGMRLPTMYEGNNGWLTQLNDHYITRICTYGGLLQTNLSGFYATRFIHLIKQNKKRIIL